MEHPHASEARACVRDHRLVGDPACVRAAEGRMAAIPGSQPGTKSTHETGEVAQTDGVSSARKRLNGTVGA